ncbi:MAG: RibD family protein [Clostridia bacterium]|nr:RibD family protein [Clostridia bacterium]
MKTHQTRPYVVCHILSALDGKISGSFFSLPETAAAGAAYGNIRSEYACDAILNGAVTASEIYADGYLASPPKNGRPVPREDFIGATSYRNYVVVIDAEGKLHWRGNIARRRGMPDSHVIEVLTENVADDYLSFLREKKISYVFAGKKELDIRTAMRKLKTLFVIDTLMCCGGGVIDWTLLQAGVVDELSLILVPAADGRRDTASVFDQSDYVRDNSPVAFSLIDVKELDGGALWLKYKPKNNME